jgi:hypothetical protein
MLQNKPKRDLVSIVEERPFREFSSGGKWGMNLSGLCLLLLLPNGQNWMVQRRVWRRYKDIWMIT